MPHIEAENDGRALPSLIVDEPEEQLRSGTFTPIPLLIGVTKHETANAVGISTLNRIFGSAQKFLNSLSGTLKGLAGFLRIDKVTGDIVQPVLPGLTTALTPSLNDVLKVPESLSLDEVMAKVFV